MTRFADKFARFLRLWRLRPRLSGRGVSVAFVAASGLAAGITMGDAVIALLSIFLALILLAAWLLAILNLRRLQLRRHYPDEVFAGDRFPIRLTIDNLKLRLNSFGIELADSFWDRETYETTRFESNHPWPDHRVVTAAVVTAGNSSDVELLSPETGEPIELTARFRKRGVFSRFQFCLSSEFPFGLFRYRIHGHAESDITVYPRPVLPPALRNMLASGTGDDTASLQALHDTVGEFKGLREFVHGDAMRLVHWPLSARYGEMVIKEFEPSAPARNTIVFHSCRPQGKHVAQPVERTLEILCGLFYYFHERGMEFDFVASFNNWEVMKINDDPSTFEDALVALALARVRSTTDVAKLKGCIADLPRQDHRIIVVSNIPVRYWHNRIDRSGLVMCLDNRLRLPAQNREAGQLS